MGGASTSESHPDLSDVPGAVDNSIPYVEAIE